MNVGLGLRKAKGIDELHATGHSLGGGLASAAVVWAGGIQGYTFNSSGLTRETIEAHQTSYNSHQDDSDRKRYTLGRYDRIAASLTKEVMAYFNVLDILTIIQDSTSKIPSAVGHRVLLEGKYGKDPITHSDAFFAGSVLQRLIPNAVTIIDDGQDITFDMPGLMVALRDLVEQECRERGGIDLLVCIAERIREFHSGLEKLIETHSLFDEALLGELYGNED